MNVLDFWVLDHFKKICSAIDILPADLNFDVSDLSEPQRPDPELASSRSGLSQQLEGYSLADGRAIPDSNQPITPDTTMAGSSHSKKKKTK
jgi:hypothetical protein